MELQVGSTPPVPSFIVTPSSELKYPSRFILDAAGSYDEDVRNGGDSLTYSWSFSSSENVILDTSQVNSSRIIVTMSASGLYKARLTVTDRFGEVSSIEKEIMVESTLRPEMIINPQV
jgi:REJ domain